VRHLNPPLNQLVGRGAIELGPGQIRSVNPDVARRIVDDEAMDAA
jgi:hypothetical protein